jgi:NAD-dependent deacetylase
MEKLIKQAATDLANSKRLVALTGAGISVESNIPPFRGKGGVWERFDPMEYAHIDAFMKNPKKVWDVLLREMKEIIDIAEPNDAHLGLARLERLGFLKTIITQNIDGLHQKAGNTDVIEFHGTFARQRCLDCHKPKNTEDILLTVIPPTCECGGIYRPEVIFFGEMIPPEHLLRSRQIASACDVMLVMGTSAVVQPASMMPVIAKEAGARVIEINPEKTPLTGTVSDYLIQGKAGEEMNRIMMELERIL